MGNNAYKKSGAGVKKKTNEITVERMMLLFVLSCIMVTILLYIGKGSAAERVFVLKVLPYVQIASAVFVLAAAVYFGVQKIKKFSQTDLGERLVTGGNMLAAAVFLFAMFMLYTSIGMIMVVTCVIVVTVLCFVYCFYARDFFWFTVLTVFGCAALFAVKNGMTVSWWKNIAVVALEALAFAVPAIVIAAAVILKIKNGKVKIGGKERSLVKEGYLYSPFVIGSTVVLAGSAVSFFVGAAVVYAIITLLALYLVYAIIYTVRMM